MLKQGLISESSSPWQGPVILVAKRHDSQPRFVLDLTRVNRQTVAISYPLPSLDSVLDTMSDHKPVLFSSLVLRHGYWQIKLEEES